jgi:1-deoxy-D-xylulose-5-phosphate synthase
MALLPNIHGPKEVKALSAEELPILAQEIRERIIQVTSRNGGHVAQYLV